MILLTGLEAATNNDILANSRLTSIPYAGILTLQFSSNLNDATNSFAVTVELPGGMIPIDAQRVPGVNPSLAGVLDDRTLLQMSFPAQAGGHFIISLTETGTAIATWLARLS